MSLFIEKRNGILAGESRQKDVNKASKVVLKEDSTEHY